MPKYTQNTKRSQKGQSLPKATRDWLAGGATKGQRNDQVFRAACQFRDLGDSIDKAKTAIWPRAEKDGLSQTETFKTIESAYSRAPRPPARGTQAGGAATQTAAPASNGQAAPLTMPAPISDGFPKLLTAAFEPDEYVAIAEAEPDGAGNWIPKAGRVLKREKWLEAYAQGRLLKIFPDKQGVFIRINPMQPGGKSDGEVAVFRHCLVEFDLDENGNRIPLETQWEAFQRSGLPITAVSFSGDKSLHGLVRIDAADRAQFDGRRAEAWELFKAYNIDPQNKNPSRYSRAPGFDRTIYDDAGNVRGTATQALLAVNLGPVNWDEFVLKKQGGVFPEIVDGEQITTNILPLPTDIISDILSLGEKGSLQGGSKTFKTWSLIHQGLAVGSGQEWWELPTIARNVLFLNLEIPPAYFEQRVRDVAAKLGISVPKTFHVWHLRHAKLGRPEIWESFLKELKRRCAAIPNPFVISDPIYKLLGGRNENATGDVSTLLEQLDDVILAVNGANFFGHHFSKGNQASKDPLDRGAGSGVFGRDPDTIFTVTRHEKEGCFVVEAILRNHKPLDSFVIRWDYPLFIRDSSLNPGELKQPRQPNQSQYPLKLFADKIKDDCLTTAQFRKRMDDETGMSKTTFHRLKLEAEKAGYIVFDGQTNTWERNKNP